MILSGNPADRVGAMSLPSPQLTMTARMTPDMANFAGNVHSGTILKFLDRVTYALASRYASSYEVTMSVDQVRFRKPKYVGELAIFLARVNYTGTSSMEIGIKVVAVDDTRKPAAVPPLRPFSPDKKIAL